MAITHILQRLRGLTMPESREAYDLLIGDVWIQAIRERRTFQCRYEVPRYFIGMTMLHVPAVPQPEPVNGHPWWYPTKRILMVWRGSQGYQRMEAADLHLARRG